MSRIQIYDTTLRDGSQAEGISFSLQDKLAITERLDSVGVDYVEGGYPASNEKDAQYFQRVRELPLAHVRVCAFGMTRRKGVKAADDEGLRALLDSRAKTITIVGKSSLFQVTEVLRTNADENLAMVRDSIAHLVANGREVIFDAEHFFDGWKADAAYSIAALRAAAEAGAGMVVLCDTNGGTMPEDIARAVRNVVESVSRAGGHPLPQRLRAGGGQFAGRRRRRGRAGPGHDQRLWRALRQRRSDLGDGQPGVEEAGLRSAGPRRGRALDRAVAVRL